MKQLKFKIISDLEEAKKLWNYFSPHLTIDDEWDFRYTFYKHLDLPLHFIVGYDGTKQIGLLPLQLNTNKGNSQKWFGSSVHFLEFFGGIDMDDNKVFILPEYQHLFQQFYNQVNNTAFLAPLAHDHKLDATTPIHYTDKFVSCLHDVTDLQTFLQKTLDRKSRQRIRHLYKNYKIEIKKGNDEDIELLFKLSKERFGIGSAFQMEHREQIFRDFVSLYDNDLFTIYIDGVAKACSFGIIHKQIYYGMNIGYDYSVRDLGKLVFAMQIEGAIENKCTRYDAGKNDNGWKENFNLDKVPQFKMALHAKEASLMPLPQAPSRPHTILSPNLPSHSKKYLPHT